MLQDHWPRVAAAAVVPVVVISACGLLCLAFYNRLSAVVSQLRAFHRERLHGQDRLDRVADSALSDPDAAARHARLLDVLEKQTAHVALRARLIRSTLLCLLTTIGCLTLCSMFAGLSVLVPAAAVLALALFAAGMVVMTVAVILAVLQLRRALDPVDLESRFVDSLTRDEPAANGLSLAVE